MKSYKEKTKTWSVCDVLFSHWSQALSHRKIILCLLFCIHFVLEFTLSLGMKQTQWQRTPQVKFHSNQYLCNLAHKPLSFSNIATLRVLFATVTNRRKAAQVILMFLHNSTTTKVGVMADFCYGHNRLLISKPGFYPLDGSRTFKVRNPLHCQMFLGGRRDVKVVP